MANSNSGDLTDLKIRNLKPVDKDKDGNETPWVRSKRVRVAKGLYIEVFPNGNKTWVARLSRDGVGTWAGLGAYPNVTLKEAHEKADKARVDLRTDGMTESQKKRADKAAVRAVANAEAERIKSTFEVVARECHQNLPAKLSKKHRAQWISSLEAHAFEKIGSRPLEEIKPNEILHDVLAKMLEDKDENGNPREPLLETASRVFQRISRVYRYAMTDNEALTDPTRRIVDAFAELKTPLETDNHHAALPYDEVAQFMNDLGAHDAMSARCLQFVILTAARTNEAIGAKWSEIDIANRTWTVPPERLKSMQKKKRGPHRVPLSTAALQLLSGLPQGGVYAFPSPDGDEPLSNMAMLTLLKRMNRQDITVHGFRSCFRTWCAEKTDVQSEVAEAALAHVPKDKIVAAYSRTDFFEKRQPLMEAWAEQCVPPAPIENNVVPMKRRGAR